MNERASEQTNGRTNQRGTHDITIRSARWRAASEAAAPARDEWRRRAAEGEGEDGGLNRGRQVSFASIAVSCLRRRRRRRVALSSSTTYLCLLPTERAGIGRGRLRHGPQARHGRFLLSFFLLSFFRSSNPPLPRSPSTHSSICQLLALLGAALRCRRRNALRYM